MPEFAPARPWGLIAEESGRGPFGNTLLEALIGGNICLGVLIGGKYYARSSDWRGTLC